MSKTITTEEIRRKLGKPVTVVLAQHTGMTTNGLAAKLLTYVVNPNKPSGAHFEVSDSYSSPPIMYFTSAAEAVTEYNNKEPKEKL